MKKGDEIICVDTRRPRWWDRIVQTATPFHCGLTLEKKYEVVGFEEMPMDYNNPLGRHRPEFVLVVDDHGYKVAYEKERFRAA